MADQPQEDWSSFDSYKRLVKARLLAADNLQEQVARGSKCLLISVFVAIILLIISMAVPIFCGSQGWDQNASNMVAVKGDITLKEECCSEIALIMWPVVLGIVGLALSGAVVVVSGHITLHRLLREE